ncbi:MAG: 3-dehydroquinate dehydratase [Burkholderiales bacterium]|nr:3-dehydroquinate dehydratase [Burkholderiales bacterium]
MPTRICVLNGPNLNLLGVREPHIYGTTTLAAIEKSCRELAAALGVRLAFRQTNHEGTLVEWVHAARDEADAIVINPAGCTFHSVSLVDALRAFEGPVIELHISNIHARDELHRHSIVSPAAKAVICGLGAYGYVVALQCAVRLLDALPASLPAAMRKGPR